LGLFLVLGRVEVGTGWMLGRVGCWDGVDVGTLDVRTGLMLGRWMLGRVGCWDGVDVGRG